MPALDEMCRGHMIADLVTILSIGGRGFWGGRSLMSEIIYNRTRSAAKN